MHKSNSYNILIAINLSSRFKSKNKVPKKYSNLKKAYLNRTRLAVALYYFAKGLCFASWASRIPDIKSNLNLSAADLGTILFALSFGQLLIIPFSAKIVNRFGSHRVLFWATFFYGIILTSLGFATQFWQLAIGLVFFGIALNVTNIAVNTQGVYAEKIFKRPIMSSFHGMWSFAGFVGALIGLLMIYLQYSPLQHFVFVLVLSSIIIVFNFKYLVVVKEAKKEKKETNSQFFSKLDKSLFLLGAVGFCSMVSEGVMFDWSGVYFKDIVKAPKNLIVMGYASFMIMMAVGRFIGDAVIIKFGQKLVLQISGFLISLGLFMAVLFPSLIACTLAFMLVGLAVATVVPTVFSIAGKNPNLSPSTSITIVSSISFTGFLIGPPVIGYIAEVYGLRCSFAFIGMFGVLIVFLVKNIKIKN